MDRKDVLKKLFKIKNCHDVDINNQLEMLSLSENVPQAVINFINNYDYKIESFLESLKNKEFYKSFKSPKTDFTKLKGLSSMLTHAIIEIEQNPNQKSLIIEALKLDEVIEALQSFIVLDNLDPANSFVDEIEKIITNIEVGEAE